MIDFFEDAETVNFPSGAFLFHAQDQVGFVHLVEAGKVSLERVQASGKITCFQRAEVGDILAEASVYARAYHCDARALEDVRLRRVSRVKFQSQLKSNPERAEDWAAHLARTVQRTRLIAEIRSYKTVVERLEAWLGEFDVLPQKGNWHSLAQELAVSPEAVYRELAKRRM